MADMSENLSKYFDAMPIPRFIVVPDNEGSYIVTAVNDLAMKYFDLSEEQIVDKKIKDFMAQERTLHFHQSFEVCISKKRSVTIQALPGVPGSVRVYGFYISPILNEAGDVEYLDVIEIGRAHV